MRRHDPDGNVKQKIREKNRSLLMQDIALLFFLLGIVAAALLVSFSETDTQRTENLAMFLVLCGAVVLSAYRFRYLSMVLCMAQICFYAVYRIYMGFMEGESTRLMCYGWLVIPIITVGAMTVSMQTTYRVNAIAELLDKQLAEQVMTDRVTGLYNQKSMYLDIERQISFSRRHGLKVSLMILELRDKEELKAVLTPVQFDTLRVALAELLEDNIRLEDRLYALDEDGRMGVLCTCDGKGANVIKGRILAAVGKDNVFRNTLGHALRVELRIGIYEYNEETVENSIDLKKKAENEMQYDV